METPDIPLSSLLVCFLLLLIPIMTSVRLKLGLVRPLGISMGRMCVQLAFIGIFLKYLFYLNSSIVNLLWLVVMIIFAVFSAIKSSDLRISRVFLPAFLSFTLSTLFIVLFVNTLVIRIDKILDARYLIVLGGMLLGNALRGNIIGISTFYQNVKKDEKHFLYVLSLGASRFEGILPYLREGLRSALQPTLATMATMGIVSLPGMMTGQILGGVSPLVAIKYQILIMVAIYVCMNLSILLTILMTLKASFSPFGTLKSDIFATG